MNHDSSPVICVTGSAKRIGAQIIRHMHSQGYRVIIHYHQSLDEAIKLAGELNSERSDSALLVQGDLNDPATYSALAAQILSCFNRLDVLIHNASRFYPTKLSECSAADWDALMHSNARAPLFLTQQLAFELKARRGSVISLLDIHSDDRPFKGYVIYNMAKAAHRMMVQSLSLDLAPEIRVNGVAPGANIWPDDDSDQAIDDPKKLRIASNIPLQSIGEPQDIAQAVDYLIRARYVTGHIIKVDGGRSLTLPGDDPA